jgi:hypothetical protein
MMTNTCTPLLRAGGDHKKIVRVPLMRYMSSKFCDDQSQLTNFKCEGWGGYIGESLNNISTWLNDVVYLKRIRNFKIVCPNKLLHWDETMKKVARRLYKYWSQDPVNMTKDGYAALAAALSETAQDLNPRRPNTSETTSQPGTSSGSGTCAGPRPVSLNRGASHQRQSWVSTDNAIAERSQQRGGYRGGRGRPWHLPAARGRGGWQGGSQKIRTEAEAILRSENV